MRAENTRDLLLVFLWFFKVYGVYGKTTTTSPLTWEQCDLRPLEAVILRLEQKFDEKVNELSHGMRAYSRNIEYHNKGTQRAFSECKNDIDRFMTERTKRDREPLTEPSEPNMNEKLDDLSKKLQLTIATLRLVDYDLRTIKKNISDVVNITNTIWEKIDTEASIQKIFKTSSQKYSPTFTSETTPKTCREIKQKSPSSPSGIYLVQPESTKPPFMVFCDMVIQNGGWLTIHNRYEGSQDFFLGWQDYKVGFGNIAGEFWLGLDKIYQLTGNQINELLIEIVDPDKFRSVAHYSYFSIGSEEEGYALKVLGGYKGNAGDALSYQAGSKFSTKDMDQDSWNEGNCAQSHSGAWWYKACDKSNLNGRYIPGQQPEQFLYQAMYWGAVTGPQVGLLEARMLVRPRENANAEFVPDSV